MRRLIALWMSVGLTTAVCVSAGLGNTQVGRAQDAADEEGASGSAGASAQVGTDGASSSVGASGSLPTTTAGQEAQSGVSDEAAGAVPTQTGVTAQVATAEDESDMDAATYAVRLRDLEQRIDALKEQIFRSKARLSLLAETVLGGVVAGAQAVIVHENRMSSSYRLVKAVYALDGARLFSKADEEGSLGDQQEFEIFNGSIVPGEHNITVNLEYRGHGYGIFSYLKGYRFRVRSSYTFTAPEGRAIQINVVGYEKGGPTAPLEERPAIRYVEQTSELGRRTSSGESQGEE